MKTKLLFFALIAVLATTPSFAQIITFNLLKGCNSYDRTSFTEEFAKKHFYIVEESVKKANNKLMEGGTLYSNQKDRDLGIAEINVLSVINGAKKITEISFLKGSKYDYSKNYGDLYTQMNSMLTKTASFQSKKYKTEVTTFTKDKVYYYAFKIKDVPYIVIANYKIEEEYF
jgi:hypothetical protein